MDEKQQVISTKTGWKITGLNVFFLAKMIHLRCQVSNLKRFIKDGPSTIDLALIEKVQSVVPEEKDSEDREY